MGASRMPKAKTLKQLKAAEANYRKIHSNLYGTERFKYGELSSEEYGTVLTAEDKRAYIDLHTRTLPSHNCGWCRKAHVMGGYCSEDEDYIPPMQSKRPSDRT